VTSGAPYSKSKGEILMNLFTCSTTIQEVVGNKCRFPSSLRQIICQSVEQIPIEDMEQLLSKHEADPDNFDGRIESNLKSIAPRAASINTNQRISNQTRFNSDIVIHKGDISICLEIEKGYMSRFEFDILKMQTFASNLLREKPKMHVFGAFIVPADNVVARHISGKSNESSYKYLVRLSRLVVQIKPALLDDILIVGYSTSELRKEIKFVKRRKTLSSSHPDKYLVKSKEGIEGEKAIKLKLSKYPLLLALVLKLRKELASKLPELYEKANFNSIKYLGYANGNRSDALYMYIQTRKQRLVLDIKVSKDEVKNLRNQGFKVNPRNNFQSKDGWLTGVSVSYDTDKLAVIVDLASLALKA